MKKTALEPATIGGSTRAHVTHSGRRPAVLAGRYEDRIEPVGHHPRTHRPIPELGRHATFTVSATGTTPLTYQWRFKELDLAGETNNCLILTNVQLTAAGDYSVVVKNTDSAVTSTPAMLDVDPIFTKVTSDPKKF